MWGDFAFSFNVFVIIVPMMKASVDKYYNHLGGGLVIKAWD
jgi:hypothetical protein